MGPDPLTKQAGIAQLVERVLDIAVSPDGEKLIRLQVKYREAKNGKVSTTVAKSTGRKWTTLTQRETDAIAIYCPDTNSVYYLSLSELTGKGSRCEIRISPARNNQKTGVRLAGKLTDANRLFNLPS